MAHQSLESVGRNIRSAVARLRAGPQRRYPARLRRRIVVYAEQRLSQGATRSKVGAELGVSDPTLSRLLRDGVQQTTLRQVRVVDDSQTAPGATEVVVTAPGGIVIAGLDVAGIAALVKALS
jgi:transposase-like protein